MNTIDVVYKYNGVLFSHERKGNPSFLDNMDGSGEHYTKRYKPDT